MTIDMYHGDNVKQVDRINIYWSDTNCNYWGWLWKDGQCIGDFNSRSTKEIENAFPQFCIEWL